MNHEGLPEKQICRHQKNIVFQFIIWSFILFLCWRFSFLLKRYRFQGILSDSTFKTNTKEIPGWTRIDFDDKNWQTARSPYWEGYEIPWLKDVELPETAFPIWGHRGKRVIYFRKTFTLKDEPDCPTKLWILVDDDYDLFVNGTLVARNQDRRTTLSGEIYEIRSRLKKGRNVLAVKGINIALASHMIIYLPLANTGLKTQKEWKPLIHTAFMLLLSLLFLIFYYRNPQTVPELTSDSSRYKWFFAVIPIAWMSWIIVFRRFPLYDMTPTIVTTPFHLRTLTFCLATGLVLTRLTIRSFPTETGIDGGRSDGTNFYLFLFIILCMASFLRLYRYEQVPPGVFQDDASFMAEGHRLISDGIWTVWIDDMNGNGTLMVYWDGLISHLMGRNLAALRMAPAGIGVFTIFIVSIIVRRLISASAALWTAFFLAVSHYHINYSRIPWDQITVPLLSATSFLLMIRWIDSGKVSRAVFSGLLCGLGLYGYAGFRVIPLIVFSIPFACRRSIRAYVMTRRFIVFLVSFACITAPLLLFWLSHPDVVLKRTRMVDIFPTLLRYRDAVPLMLQSLKTLLMSVFIGDGVTPRHNTTGYPALDPVTGAFFLMGLVMLFRKDLWVRWISNGRPAFDLLRTGLIGWLFWGTVVSSVTFEAPHFSRSINLLFPLIFIAALGAWAYFRHWPTGSARFVVIVLLCIAITTLNFSVYFIEKFKDDRIWEHCGFPAVTLNRCIDELQRMHPAPDIHLTPLLWYLTSKSLSWFHPDIFRQPHPVVENRRQLNEIFEESSSQKIYLYVHPNDRRRFSGVDVQHKRPFRDPLGKLMFEEYIFFRGER